MPKKQVVPYKELKEGTCPKTGNGHRVFISMTGDSYPAFCASGCGCVSDDVPPEVYEDL